MGKKGKDRKKGKGAEKTHAKTEKKLSNRLKKELKNLGEDDIENIVAQIEKEEKQRLQVTEIQLEQPPSRRLNFSFLSHPVKDQLILYGGEYFNGQKTFIYGDLFFFNIQNNTWMLVKAPAGPPPRCGHQMVATSANKGELWLFGGEYASPTQSQFYHYRDLWVYHIANKQWEKIASVDGPSARSGHRMVLVKKQIFVFGGFHDNLKDYKYFNDVYTFNLETYKWKKLEPVGTPPAPRSGCCMVSLLDGKILIYGGYSKEKIKKDVDAGKVYTDAFLLGLDKHDPTQTKYKWQQIKIGGQSFSPRCSMPVVSSVNNLSAYCYGGVFDIEEDEENISGNFFNDFYMLDLEKLVWHSVVLNRKSIKENKPRRKLNKNEEDIDDENVSEVEETMKSTTISDDGVFKVTIGPSTASKDNAEKDTVEKIHNLFQPSSRMNCGLAINHGVLYLYGGMFEDGDKQYTFNDLYSIDLKKLDEWKTIINDDSTKMEWLGSDSESDNSESEESEEDNSDSESDMDTT
ncbi:kelch domain-containing protein 4 [Sitophilus oryzae]|uniref:Kelch domain-containing protein 4 n=1 Tax=Sitophilus oryzae TaxID=7048 RepID=A0A6J2XYQ9_SITOR|nr:kelch domain-containing protein 4 [Sitophilus oryzae]